MRAKGSNHNPCNISRSPGIYAIRHKTEGLLYIGKAQNLRSRFSGGHKAFLWAWLDKYGDEDVRIAVQAISHWENPGLLLELEAIILRATEPPYNPHSAPQNVTERNYGDENQREHQNKQIK